MGGSTPLRWRGKTPPQRWGAPALGRPSVAAPQRSAGRQHRDRRDEILSLCNVQPARQVPLCAQRAMAGSDSPPTRGHCAAPARQVVMCRRAHAWAATHPTRTTRRGLANAALSRTAPRRAPITVARPRPRCSSRPARPGSQRTTCPRPWSITRPLMARTRRCAPDPDPWGTTSVVPVIDKNPPVHLRPAPVLVLARPPGSPGPAAHLPRASSSTPSPGSTASTRRFAHGVTERTPRAIAKVRHRLRARQPGSKTIRDRPVEFL